MVLPGTYSCTGAAVTFSTTNEDGTPITVGLVPAG